MSTEIKTHNLDNFSSDFERRFSEASDRFKKEGDAARAQFETHTYTDEDEPGVLDGVSRKWLGYGAVIAAAVGLTVVGVGKTTLGETSPKGGLNIPAMQERAKQVENASLQHAKETGEPLVSDQK
jgi:hypothetical protein